MDTEYNNQDVAVNSDLQQYRSSSDILIIDDALDNLAVLDQLLTDRGYEVRFARDGEAGLRAARVQPPSLILLDVRLPQMDGYAVCAELKTTDTLRHIPVIFISAVHDDDHKLKAIEVGGIDYITKPFRANEVLARVETHLDLARLREQEKALSLTKERRRLARDLHDSVKQTLFMISSTAESLQLHPDMPEDKRAHRLDQLRQLSQTAIAEMNVMLFELNPRKLLGVDLVILLQQLVESLTGRTQATLTITTDPLACTLPPCIKVAFYRIAQEALTNVIRHAEAVHITISVVESNKEVEMVIKDDGVGFDVNVIPSPGFGLDNMRERADTPGLQLIINSEPACGTQVRLVWSKKQ